MALNHTSRLDRWLDRPEKLFLVLAVVFGIGNVFLMPPFVGHDDQTHFLRSYDLQSGGRLFPPMNELGQPLRQLPRSLTNLLLFPQAVIPEGRAVTAAEFRAAAKAIDRADTELYAEPPTLPVFPLLYLPSMIGIHAAQSLGGNALAVYYASRLANLVAGIALVWLALRVMPIKNRLMLALAVSPLCINLLASSTPEGLICGVAFLLLALLSRWITTEERMIRGGDLVLLGSLGMLAGLFKAPLAAIVLLAWAVPVSRFGTPRAKVVVCAGLMAISLAPAAVWAKTVKRHTPAEHHFPGYRCAPNEQLRATLRRPDPFIKGVAHALPGILDVSGLTDVSAFVQGFHHLARYGWSIFIFALAIIEPSRCVPRRVKLGALAVFALAVLGILSAMYLWWCPIGSKLIFGVQPRYLLPVLPCLFVAFANQWVTVRGDGRLLTGAVAIVGVTILIHTMLVMIGFYYMRGRSTVISADYVMPALFALMMVALISLRRRVSPPADTETTSAKPRAAA
jgi:uncharacterized membrane protein